MIFCIENCSNIVIILLQFLINYEHSGHFDKIHASVKENLGSFCRYTPGQYFTWYIYKHNKLLSVVAKINRSAA